MLPFGSASFEGRRFNPLPYSPLLTRFDQDGDGDFDLQDVKLLFKKKLGKNEEKIVCGVMTKKGEPCTRTGNPEYNNRCYHHKSSEKTN